MTGNELNDYQKAEKWLERYEFECDQEADGNLATICEALQEIWQYQEIGTVGECREARERQIAKKIILNSEDDREFEDFICPNCKDILQQRRKGATRITIYKFKFCHNCGQKLDWSE